jgi:hypothetical protein
MPVGQRSSQGLITKLATESIIIILTIIITIQGSAWTARQMLNDIAKRRERDSPTTGTHQCEKCLKPQQLHQAIF